MSIPESKIYSYCTIEKCDSRSLWISSNGVRDSEAKSKKAGCGRNSVSDMLLARLQNTPTFHCGCHTVLTFCFVVCDSFLCYFFVELFGEQPLAMLELYKESWDSILSLVTVSECSHRDVDSDLIGLRGQGIAIKARPGCERATQ